MPGATYPSGVFDHAVFNVPRLSDIPGTPQAPSVPLTNSHFAPNRSLPAGYPPIVRPAD
jgi:hypothetical protein